MLVANREDGYRIVTQNEHAAMAGRFADHWGNERFDAPNPTAAMRAAGYTHDNGWWTWDLYPHLGTDGAPINLFEVPAAKWEQFYEVGIENAVTMDPYVGLLVSMHGSGVRRRRYGTAPSMPDRSEEYAAFIAREESRQRRLAGDLRGSDRYGAFVTDGAVEMLDTLHETGGYGGDNALWRGYCLLQFWDRLALHCCLPARLESATLGPVPVSSDDGTTDVDVAPEDGTTAALDPYPFDVDPLVVSVRERTIPEREFVDETDLRSAFYEADLRTTAFTLCARDDD
ncbi:DUF3891 family protein [Halomarina pelagica]|uniref:DUF3891 family protein n=1 Tax=Halomarina pelagica TaxID=2961599 RepID=UPI0020C4ED7E|nr:DUF3891 family protein [Halomarina sp. BND7]